MARVHSLAFLYTYNSQGNLISKSTYSFTGSNPVNGTLKSHALFTYNTNSNWKDQLLNVSTYSDYPTPDTLIDTYTYSYDSFGRPTSFKGSSITYDNENRIAAIGTNSYSYDINNLRRTKSDGTNATTFYYDNEGVLVKEERSNYPHIIYHYNGNDVIGFSLKTSSNTEYVDYIYSKNLQNDIIRIYKLSDMSVVAEYEYDAFGNINMITDINNIASINPFRYRSYYYDSETNLYYLKSRYYSPELMRFLTPDRISILDDTMDNIDACNLYVYCANNPVMYVDPDGDEWWNPFSWSNTTKIIVGAVIIVGLAFATIATGGAAGGAAGFILAGALKGAVVGAITSAAIGGTISGISSYISNDNFWSGFYDGASSGFMTGAFIGAITGAISSGIQVHNAASCWDKGTFKSSLKSMKYHYKKQVINKGFKHGNSIVKYTNDALNFAQNNGMNFTLNLSRNGLQNSWSLGRAFGSGMNGLYTSSGNIISFHYFYIW